MPLINEHLSISSWRKTKKWDVGGDEFGSIDEVGVFEVANLSLDEPKLEAFLVQGEKDIMRDEDANKEEVP